MFIALPGTIFIAIIIGYFSEKTRIYPQWLSGFYHRVCRGAVDLSRI